MGPWRQTGSSLVRRALSGEEVDVFTESPSSASSFTTIPASTDIPARASATGPLLLLLLLSRFE